MPPLNGYIKQFADSATDSVQRRWWSWLAMGDKEAAIFTSQQPRVIYAVKGCLGKFMCPHPPWGQETWGPQHASRVLGDWRCRCWLLEIKAARGGNVHMYSAGSQGMPAECLCHQIHSANSTWKCSAWCWCHVTVLGKVKITQINGIGKICCSFRKK